MRVPGKSVKTYRPIPIGAGNQKFQLPIRADILTNWHVYRRPSYCLHAVHCRRREFNDAEGNGFPRPENYPFASRCAPASGAATRTGTFQISSAYSRMVRSDENHGIRATLRIEARVQAGTTCQRASMPRCAS